MHRSGESILPLVNDVRSGKYRLVCAEYNFMMSPASGGFMEAMCSQRLGTFHNGRACNQIIRKHKYMGKPQKNSSKKHS